MKAKVTATFYRMPAEVFMDIQHKFVGTYTLREDGTYDVTIDLFTTDNDNFINRIYGDTGGNTSFIGINGE